MSDWFRYFKTAFVASAAWAVVLLCLELQPAAQGASPELVFPHVVHGAGYRSLIVFTNWAEAPAALEIRAYLIDGRPWSLELDGIQAASHRITLPSGGARQLATSGAAGALESGWLRISSLGPAEIGASLILQHYAQSQLLSETILPPAPPASRLRFYVDETRDITTGIAAANSGTGTASGRLTVRNERGSLLGVADLRVPAGQQRAFFLNELVPTASTGWVDLQVEAGLLSVAALRFHGQGLFSSLQVDVARLPPGSGSTSTTTTTTTLATTTTTGGPSTTTTTAPAGTTTTTTTTTLPTTLTNDFTPPSGRSPGSGDRGPGGTRLMTAFSADGLSFSRTSEVITDQGDVPDLVVDARGWIYLYYVGWTVGNEFNKIVVAISLDGGRSWIYKKAVVSGFESMSDPVDPDVVLLADGTFRLYVTAGPAGSQGQQQSQTWYADGRDGIHFTRQGVAFSPPGVPLDPSVLRAGSQWHILAGGSTRQPGANWHGTSADGRSFAFDEEKVFLKDGKNHAMSNGLPVSNGYRFYGFSHDTVPVINSFFSADGRTWTAEPGTRLEPNPGSGLEGRFVKDAAVARLADGRYLMVYVTPVPEGSTSSGAGDLLFTPDAGLRVDNASLPKPGIDAQGTVHLYYQDHSRQPPRELVAQAADGLNFAAGRTPSDRAYDPLRLRLPNGTWRLYQWDPRALEMRSSSSPDGLRFTLDSGVRYRLQASDRGTMGVYDHFTDSAGGVVLLYIGDMLGLNNIRRAYSPPGDNGWTFSYDRGDVLGDAAAGGGPNSYVDQKSIRLPDGRLRLFVMKQGTIYSFISSDDGRSFQLEPGPRLSPGAFREFSVRTLHDPLVIRLPNGRYRMYVAAAVEDGSGRVRFAVVSATTARA